MSLRVDPGDVLVAREHGAWTSDNAAIIAGMAKAAAVDLSSIAGGGGIRMGGWRGRLTLIEDEDGTLSKIMRVLPFMPPTPP
jgi:hypothetical protein